MLPGVIYPGGTIKWASQGYLKNGDGDTLNTMFEVISWEATLCGGYIRGCLLPVGCPWGHASVHVRWVLLRGHPLRCGWVLPGLP